MMVLFGTTKLNAATATTPTNAQNDAYIYDSSANSWSKVSYTGSTAPSVRSGARCGLLNNKVYVFGGQTDENTVLGDTWYLDLASSAWTQVSATNAPYARVGHSGAAIGVWLAVFGGNQAPASPNGDNIVHLLDARSNAWQSVAPNFTVNGVLVAFPSLTASPTSVAPAGSNTGVTNTAGTSSSSGSGSSSGLSAGAIIGAAVSGTIVFIAIVAALSYAFYRLRILRGQNDFDDINPSSNAKVASWRNSVRPSFAGSSTMSDRGAHGGPDTGGGTSFSRNADFGIKQAQAPRPPTRSINPVRVAGPPPLVAMSSNNNVTGAGTSSNLPPRFVNTNSNSPPNARPMGLPLQGVPIGMMVQPPPNLLQRPLASNPHPIQGGPSSSSSPPQSIPPNQHVNPNFLRPMSTATTLTSFGSRSSSSTILPDEMRLRQELSNVYDAAARDSSVGAGGNLANRMRPDSQATSAAGNSGHRDSRPLSFGSTTDETPTHSAIATYTPQMEDELELASGDSVVLT